MTIDDYDEKMNKSRENFDALEAKLKTIISKCTKSNLIVTNNDYTIGVLGFMGVKNTNRFEHYVLEDNVHVYKLFHDNQPIDYFISDGPLEETYQFTNVVGKQTTGKNYTAIPFIEYTAGGIANCLAIDHLNKYPVNKTISAAVPSSNKTVPYCDLTCASGFRTEGCPVSTLGNWKYSTQEGMQDLLDAGDFCGYIRNIKPIDEDLEMITYLRNTLDKIDKLSLVKTPEKKSLLKSLLSRNKELTSALEPFEVSKTK